jgi:DNA-binding NarL/FixJ family response regulator
MTPPASTLSPTPAPSITTGPAQTVFRVFVIEGQTAERVVLAQLINRDPTLQPDGEAATTTDALKMLEAETAAPDIIVVSWLLDGGRTDRWAFVDELRRRAPGARLVMTCPTERGSIVRAAREHAITSLHATADSFQSLRKALHHAAQGRAYLSPRMQEAEARAEALNPRHREILTLMAEGASRPEIAKRLGISEATVRSHSKAIFQKLGVNERAHAVAVGIRTGLIR